MTNLTINKPSHKPLKPVMGYRFTITGNFLGSGKSDTLTEHFISGITHREINKLYEDIDYDSLIVLTAKKKPELIVISSNKKMRDFLIRNGMQFGLSYLKNEGDINGDGRDEISYVINYADWSNLNNYNIATYKNNKWQNIYSFPIWEWQLPDIPQTYNEQGFAGLTNLVPVRNDTINRKIMQNFKDFKGLIQKIANNKIRIIYRNDADPDKGSFVDTTVVDIRKKRFD